MTNMTIWGLLMVYYQTRRHTKSPSDMEELVMRVDEKCG